MPAPMVPRPTTPIVVNVRVCAPVDSLVSLLMAGIIPRVAWRPQPCSLTGNLRLRPALETALHDDAHARLVEPQRALTRPQVALERLEPPGLDLGEAQPGVEGAVPRDVAVGGQRH